MRIEEDSRSLYLRWCSVGTELAAEYGLSAEAGDADRPAESHIDGLLKPTVVTLRSRYYALMNVAADADPCWFSLSFDEWSRQIDLVPLGEEALAAGDIAGAEAYFKELEQLGRAPTAHPVVLIDALIGLGDVERTRDNTEAAAALYRRADELAQAQGLLFGRVRAMMPWLILQHRARATEELLPAIEWCEQAARELDDPLYLANFQIVRAEVLSAIGDTAGALAAAEIAAGLFGDHPVALPGLYVRLADSFRMAGDRAGMRRAVLRLLGLLRRVNQPVAKSDALDLLATGRMADRQWDSGRIAAKAAIKVAEGCDYGRGIAYANITLSQIERKAGNIDEALVARRVAADFFAGRDDSLGSLAYCLVESAELLNQLGRSDEAAMDARRALTALETLRCQQSRPTFQHEYRTRFAQVYRRSLQLACEMGDPILFVTVFEGLWGRRLAGLSAGPGPAFEDDAVMKAHVFAQATLAGSATAETGRQRAQRMLGRTAFTSALPGMVEDATGSAIASLSTPYDPELAKSHLEGIPSGTAALLLAPMPERPTRFFALIVDTDGYAACGEFEMPEQVRRILDDWRSAPLLDAIEDLAPLTALLPSELAQIPVGTPLLLIPLEEFWPLPWTAIPFGEGTVLGARHPLRICPSLALAEIARSQDHPENHVTYQWIGPEVNAHDLAGLPSTECGSAAEVLNRLTQGELTNDVIVVAHGIPVDGIGHFLNLGDGLTLSPLQAMRATPPGRVALISCWGAYVPGEQSGDPLTVATILQARGASCVLATSAELSDDLPCSYFVNTLLNDESTDDWSVALFNAVRNNHDFPEFRDNLRRWAPLRVIGAW